MRNHALLLGLALALVLCFWYASAFRVPETSNSVVQLDIEAADFGAGNRVELFINSLTRMPALASLEGGGRRVVSLPVPEDITEVKYLRLDPGTLPNVSFKVHELRIVDGDEVLFRIPGAAFKELPTMNLQLEGAGDGYTQYATLTNDPVVICREGGEQPIPVNGRVWLPGLFSYLTAMRDHLALRDGYMYGAVAVSVMLVLGAGMLAGCCRAEACLGALGCGLALGLVGLGRSHLIPALSFAGSVGCAGFHGIPKSMDTLALPAIAGGALLAAGVGLVWDRAFRRSPAAPLCAPREEARPGPVHGLVLATLVGLTAVAIFPDFASLAEGLRTLSYPVDWDSTQSLSWTAFHRLGLVPYRDFWYPYSSLYIFDAAFPYGDILKYFYRLYIYGSFLVLSYHFFRKNLLVTAAVYLFVFGLQLAGLGMTGLHFERYFPILVCITGILVVLESQHFDHRTLLFSGMAFLLFIFDLTSALSVACGMGAAVTLRLLSTPRREWRGFLLRLARLLAPLAAAWGLWFVNLAAQGQLRGLYDFWTSAAAMGNASASWSDIMAWLTFRVSRVYGFSLGIQYQLLCVSIYLACGMVAAGVYLALARRGEERFTGTVLAAFGVSVFPVLGKFIVRSHMQPIAEMLFLLLLPGLVYWTSIRRPRPVAMERWTRFVPYVLAFLCVALFWQGRWDRVVLSGLVHMGQAPSVLGMGRQEMAALNGRTLSAEAFSNPAVGRTVDTIRELAGDNPRSFYILNDTPHLYFLSRQIPPYHSNQYNAAALSDQRLLVSQLERERRPYLLSAAKSSFVFDLVQNPVRNPVLWRYVVSRYRYSFIRDGYVFFHRSTAGVTPQDIAAWLDLLGPEVDLGYIPSAGSYAPEEGEEVPAGSTPVELLALHFTSPPPRDSFAANSFIKRFWGRCPLERREQVVVAFGPYVFTVSFKAVAGQDSYVINLSNLWFWDLCKAANLPLAVQIPDAMAWKALRRPALDVLY